MTNNKRKPAKIKNGENKTNGRKVASRLEERLLNMIAAEGFELPEREYKFDEHRRWRFDFAWPSEKIALEVEGGLYSQRVRCHVCGAYVMRRTATGRLTPVYAGGRHTTAHGFTKDREKYNSAVLAGWQVYGVTGSMISSGYAVELLHKIFDRKDEHDVGGKKSVQR